ncbi:MAG: NifB/NifX family molybdenum-iron cluster-binding protein [Thermanaerothrix sp.]|nr:NifB/NifX family molybdenum-iron cluster-binding protein [Thermanaerothrix sp.]
MKIAIPVEGQNLCRHFGHAPHFLVATTEGSEVTAKELLDNPGHEMGRIPAWLAEIGVRAVISGGMGERAVNLLRSKGIEVYLGVTGPAELALEMFLNGKLKGGESLCSHQLGHQEQCGHGGEGCSH